MCKYYVDSSLKMILLHMLSVIIQDAKELGCEIKTYHVDSNCWLLANTEKKKTIAFGLVPDLNNKDRKKIGAIEIKINKWIWAECEGFTKKQMIDKELGVFEIVPVHEVSRVLANK